MSIGAMSHVANVVNSLLQLSESRKQQVEVDLEVGEATRRARQQAVDKCMQDLQKQAERVNEIKKAALQARNASGASGASIDVWA